jgi:hypothetical protein
MKTSKENKEKEKKDLFESAQGATVKIFSNVNAFKVMTKLNGDKFKQDLYTMPFKLVKENFSTEFYAFLKKNYNDKEWDYVILIENLIKNKDSNKNLKKDIQKIYEEYFFDKKGEERQILNFDQSYYSEILKKFQDTPEDPNIFSRSKKKVLNDLGKIYINIIF